MTRSAPWTAARFGHAFLAIFLTLSVGAPVASAATDTKRPAVTLDKPADGAKLTAQPTYSGKAGTAPGDLPTITVNVYSGSTATGTPKQTLTTGASGSAWSVAGNPDLTSGTYTAQARQSDSSGNIGISAERTFTLSVPTPPPPPTQTVTTVPPASGPTAACAATSPYASKVIGTPGLVGYWRLGESAGTTTVCDAAGTDVGTYQPGATLGQPGAITSDANTAATFSGAADSWASVPDSSALRLGDRFTIEAWVKRSSTGTENWDIIASKQYHSWLLGFLPDDTLLLRRAGVGNVATSTTPLTDTSQWHYIVATKDGPTVHLYIDGADVTGPVTDQTMSDDAAMPLTIGQSGNDSYFHGAIDEVGLYSVALTPAQVADHFAARNATTMSSGSTDPVVSAAGDIACDPTDGSYNGGSGTADNCRERDTANLLAANGPDGVITLGDNQYVHGDLASYSQSYAPTWGRFKATTHPDSGNHDYDTSGAAGYFDYFDGSGAQSGPAGDRGKGYYSYDIGTWHVIALNSNCAAIGGCQGGSAEETWLKSDLSAHKNTCTLAYWHHPRFSSGWSGSSTMTGALFTDLYNANADLLLVGHDHDYERFAPQNQNGQLDTNRGIREFIVGTGGEDHDVFVPDANGNYAPNSQVRNSGTFGILRLTLHPSSYDWQFVPVAGQTFTDSGTQACH